MGKLRDRLSLKRDGRKYRLAIICLAVLIGCFGLATLNPVLSSLFVELVDGVVTILAVYAGANVFHKWARKPKAIVIPTDDLVEKE